MRQDEQSSGVNISIVTAPRRLSQATLAAGCDLPYTARFTHRDRAIHLLSASHLCPP